MGSFEVATRLGEAAALITGEQVDPIWAADGRTFTYRSGERFLEVDPETGLSRPADEPSHVTAGVGPTLCEVDGDLWIRPTSDGELRRLTDDADADRPWVVDGALWSPDSATLLVARTDNRGLRRIPVVDWLTDWETVETVAYSRVGGSYAKTEAFLVDAATGNRTPIELSRDELFFFRPLRWLPDGPMILSLDRAAKCLRLELVDPQTGRCSTVADERQDTFVYGLRTWFAFADIVAVDDGKRVVWTSERDGWRHAYLYSIDGELITQLTRGTFDVDRVVGVGGDRVWVQAHSDPLRPFDVHLCSVDLAGGDFRQLTSDPGMHAGVLSPSGDRLLDTHSSLERPPRTDLLDASGAVVAVVAEADVSALAGVEWPVPELFVAKAADGVTDLYGALWLPPDFDPARRYPVIDFIYAGPQAAVVPRNFHQAHMAQTLSRLGFVTFVVDARGTPGRGKAFADVIYGKLGQAEISDHRAVLAQLAADRPYVDASRVGIVGSSWGGYMTMRAAITEPDAYQVAVSIYPFASLSTNAAGGIEPYMGLLADNPEGYTEADLLGRVNQLSAKLLLVAGTSDINAAFGGTMKLLDALVRAGKPYDLILIPGMDHSSTDPRLAYVIEQCSRYLVEHLRPETFKP